MYKLYRNVFIIIIHNSHVFLSSLLSLYHLEYRIIFEYSNIIRILEYYSNTRILFEYSNILKFNILKLKLYFKIKIIF